MPSADDRFGTTTLDGGRVTLDAPLGEGGMGTVYRGRLRDHDAAVAVKLLRVEGLDPAERATLAARLRDEASAAGRVVHPNLVRILASGDCPQGGPYIVYELVEGGSLEERLEAGPLPWEEVEEHLAPQLLGALEALHAAGVVHRDVKPDNIFVTPDGRYLLGDLGLAVFEGRSAATATGVVVGTPGYLAPERLTALDTRLTPTADVYAAAMVLVRAAAGRLPFAAVAPAALVREQLTRSVSASTLEELGLPPAPARVLSAALDRHPQVRPPSAAALLRALSEGVLSSPRPARSSLGARPNGRPRRRRPLVAGLALAVSLGLAGLVFLRLERPVAVVGGRTSPTAGDEVAWVTAARPFLPDAVVERVLAAAAASHGDQVRALVRSVALTAGTTSPAGLGARLLPEVRSPGQAIVAARRYGALLRSAPAGRVATATALLTALMVRSVPDEGEVLDDLALSACVVLARQSPPDRADVPARRLAVALDGLLAQASQGGPPPSAREALGLALRDPNLRGGPSGLAGALGLPPVPSLSPALFEEAARHLAAPSLDRSETREQALETLVTDRLSVAVRVSLGRPGALDEGLGSAAALVVEDWYRLLPLAAAVAGPPPPERPDAAFDAHWSMGVKLLRRYSAPSHPSACRPVMTGPFRGRPLAARLGLGAVVLAERAALGDPRSRTLLVRDLHSVAHWLVVFWGPGAAVFLDAIEASLSGAPSCTTARLLLRGSRAVSAEHLEEARVLFVRAAESAVLAAEAAGPSCTVHDLDAIRHTLHRLGLEVLTPEQRMVARALEGRVRLVAERLRALPGLSPYLWGAATSILTQLERPVAPDFLEE